MKRSGNKQSKIQSKKTTNFPDLTAQGLNPVIHTFKKVNMERTKTRKLLHLGSKRQPATQENFDNVLTICYHFFRQPHVKTVMEVFHQLKLIQNQRKLNTPKTFSFTTHYQRSRNWSWIKQAV